MTRITVRLDDDLKDEFSEHCEQHGESMSGKIKAFIRDEIGQKSHGPLPDDPELAKAYRQIWQLRSSNNRVAVEDVEPEVANTLNIPKKAVRRRIFSELDERGYINVKVGTITANVDIDPSGDDLETDATRSMEVPADD